MTVCRRYHELVKNLTATLELAAVELGYAPDVVLVWARPEVPRLWVVQQLLAEGKLKHVIGRPELPGEMTSATTYPESVNIRQGLDYIRANYDPATHYVIFQTADVQLRGGTLHFVDHHMEEGNEAVVFHWENNCVRSDIWSTNFFGVSLDPLYWPPVSPPEHQDVLERQWGVSLCNASPPGVHKWHNYQARRFAHVHESETLPAYDERPQREGSGFRLTVRGYKPWLVRLYEFARRVWRGVCFWKK